MTTEPRSSQRAAGVLLHVTSLPGPYGSGDLGAAARNFVDFLAHGGQRYWQTLPVNPVGLGNSPYCGLSVFAGNPLLISLDDLVEQGLLSAAELEGIPAGPVVDFERSRRLRVAAVRRACVRFRERGGKYLQELQELRARQRFWLADYALFCAARAHHQGRPWTEWEPALARHDPAAVKDAARAWADEIELYEVEQLLFDKQWRALRSYAATRGVSLIGDAPLFVAHDSADVWGNQAMFRLDQEGQPTHVSGVPPDYFSATGQRWGMPLYRWKVLARDGYRFWVQRLSTLLERFDLVRLDHFIGFVRYWEIPAEEETAINGRWMKGPGAQLFEVLQRKLSSRSSLASAPASTLPNSPEEGDKSEYKLPFIAEDLGCVNGDVHALRDKLGLPGMRVLQFGFGGAAEHLPHQYPPRSVAYTGTHDTNTIVGWLEEQAGEASVRTAAQIEQERRAAVDYVAGPRAPEPLAMHRAMIRVLFASAAQTVIIPMQDWLGLGAEARMNMPGHAQGNWRFRLPADALSDQLAQDLLAYVKTYER